jgi:prefoldin subunit 5
MAEYGEWNRKGATLSDVTARKEYGVSQAFIVKGMRKIKKEMADLKKRLNELQARKTTIEPAIRKSATKSAGSGAGTRAHRA